MKKYKSVTATDFKRDDNNTLGVSGQLKYPGAKSITPHIWEKPEVVIIKKLKRYKKKQTEDK